MMVACQPWPTGRPWLNISEPDARVQTTPETTPELDLSLALSERASVERERARGSC